MRRDVPGEIEWAPLQIVLPLQLRRRLLLAARLGLSARISLNWIEDYSYLQSTLKKINAPRVLIRLPGSAWYYAVSPETLQAARALYFIEHPSHRFLATGYIRGVL